MALNPVAATTDEDIQALEALCERLAGFDELVNLEWLDGYMAALAAGPRRTALEEWLPVFADGVFERAFGDPADAQQAAAVIAKRWNELCHQLDAEAILDQPETLRLDPLMYRFDDESTDPDAVAQENDGAADDADAADAPAAGAQDPGTPDAEAVAPEASDDTRPADWPGDGVYWSLGFSEAIEDFAEDWVEPEPGAEDESLFYDLLESIALLSSADEEERKDSIQRLYDGADLDRDELIAEAMYAVQELRMYWLNHASKPATRVVGEKVGRNDPCPCGSGKKYKKCCGASA